MQPLGVKLRKVGGLIGGNSNSIYNVGCGIRLGIVSTC